MFLKKVKGRKFLLSLKFTDPLEPPGPLCGQGLLLGTPTLVSGPSGRIRIIALQSLRYTSPELPFTESLILDFDGISTPTPLVLSEQI